MTFELTELLTDEILFAMEDQNSVLMMDAKEGLLVLEDDVGGEADRYYELPEWSSEDGYNLMEEFTNNLYAPRVHDELKRVLVSGRGVFRNFKNVLKNYPETEKKWHLFKDAKMRERVCEWYNELRESWGLEKLFLTDDSVESTEELVLNDFEFQEFNLARDANEIEIGTENAVQELKTQFSEDLGSAIACMWKQLSSYSTTTSKSGFVCRSLAGEFAGCILLDFCPQETKKAVVITDFFVVQEYRGLGIGEQLLAKALSFCKKRGIRHIIICNTFIPQFMESLLFQKGFFKIGSGYAVDLNEE
ncbi:MAG TPA: hypothetical protein DCP61_00605 [Treponema sp.]|nr:hypothetical protein [Treponema sp.]